MPYRTAEDIDAVLAAQAERTAEMAPRLEAAEHLLSEVSCSLIHGSGLPDTLLKRIDAFLNPPVAPIE